MLVLSIDKDILIKKPIAPTYLLNGSFVSNAFVYGKRFSQKHQLACFEGARNVVTSYKTRLVCTVPTLWALGFYYDSFNLRFNGPPITRQFWHLPAPIVAFTSGICRRSARSSLPKTPRMDPRSFCSFTEDTLPRFQTSPGTRMTRGSSARSPRTTLCRLVNKCSPVIRIWSCSYKNVWSTFYHSFFKQKHCE